MIEYSGNVVLSMFLRYRDMIMARINLVVSVVLFLKLMGARSRKEFTRQYFISFSFCTNSAIYTVFKFAGFINNME